MRTTAIFLIMHRLTDSQNARTAIKSIKMSFRLLKNSLINCDSSYIYNSCCRRRNGEDLTGRTQTGKIYAGAKKCPPAGISLRPSKELDSHGKKLVKQLVSRKVNIWKETERH